MQNLKKEFPLLNTCIYTNTAASGMLYDSLLEWRQEHDLDFLIGGSEMKMRAMINYIPEVRKTVGNFFNCTSKNVALIPNFSIGLNLLLEGLDKNHKILLLENDYPSVNWPFEQRGFDIYYAGLNEKLEENIYNKVKTENISVLALSLVQWLNGIHIDLEFLKTLKNDFPDLIIIADGTQFCGMIDFDFENSAIDVLGASAYKWLLAGYGNGFMLFKDQVKEKFSSKSTGFNAANGNIDGKKDIRFAKGFEPGHLDTLNFGSLKFSLDFLKSIGMGTIDKQNKLLSLKVKEIFTEMDLLEDSVVQRKNHSSIYNVKGDDKLFNLLKENNIVCSRRGDGIRLSFHFYNTEDDINQIIRILKTAK